MKKVVLLGGSGTIGSVLARGLKEHYHVVIMDMIEPSWNGDFIQVDATNYEDLLEKTPGDTDVIINLLRTDTTKGIEDKECFEKLTSVFFQASYYILLVAREKGIRRVVYASSNHVTDAYEKDGFSLLGREITVEDVPKSKGLYGVLKFASEQLGALFAEEGSVSVINLRIASVPPLEKRVLNNERLKRTLLKDEDAVHLVRAAIETDKAFGTYYGVSDWPNKPWSTLNAYEDLGFQAKR